MERGRILPGVPELPGHDDHLADQSATGRQFCFIIGTTLSIQEALIAFSDRLPLGDRLQPECGQLPRAELGRGGLRREHDISGLSFRERDLAPHRQDYQGRQLRTAAAKER